jgi:hypothetical protein
MLELAGHTEPVVVVPVRGAFSPPSNRWRTGLTLLRLAERRFCGLLFQEPPRTTRREGVSGPAIDPGDRSPANAGTMAGCTKLCGRKQAEGSEAATIIAADPATGRGPGARNRESASQDNEEKKLIRDQFPEERCAAGAASPSREKGVKASWPRGSRDIRPRTM